MWQNDNRGVAKPANGPQRKAIALAWVICFLVIFTGGSAVGQEAGSEDTNVEWTPERVAEECPLAFRAERLTLYRQEPRPLWFFPLLLSEAEQIGIIDPEGDIRICETAYRSTWRERSLWLRVVVKPANTDGFVEGWLTVGPRDLNSFVDQATGSREQRNGPERWRRIAAVAVFTGPRARGRSRPFSLVASLAARRCA